MPRAVPAARPQAILTPRPPVPWGQRPARAWSHQQCWEEALCTQDLSPQHRPGCSPAPLHAGDLPAAPRWDTKGDTQHVAHSQPRHCRPCSQPLRRTARPWGCTRGPGSSPTAGHGTALPPWDSPAGAGGRAVPPAPWELGQGAPHRTPTSSSVPSSQSAAPSQRQASGTHCLLWGHATSPARHSRGRGTAQPSSSDPSRQSRSPSQRRDTATHCPLRQGNSAGLHSLGAARGDGDERGALRSPRAHPAPPPRLTAVLLVGTVQAVGVAIAQPALGDAAGGSVAAQGAVLRGAPAARLVRGVGALRHPVAALASPDAHGAAHAAEGPWGDEELCRALCRQAGCQPPSDLERPQITWTGLR